MPITITSTTRLYLRAFTEGDAALIWQLNSDPLVTKYVHERLLESEEDARQVLRDIILPQYERKLGRWAVHLKENDNCIGWCGLKYLPDTGEVDLGYRFFPKYWGMGYATEAAAQCLAFGTDELGLALIGAKVHIDNIASQKVLEKIGMRYRETITEDNTLVKAYDFPPNSL